MASQFFGLNIAYTGLTASNASLNTTANNIANTETKGYSRQTVNQTAADALRSYTTYGCSGAGVEANSVERTRDAFYDFKYWNNNSGYGENSELAYYMKQIEDYFTDTDTVKGFTTVFNEMYTSLSEVSKSAGDSTVKSQFVGYAEEMAYYFNSMASNLEKLQSDCNQEIKNKVDQINAYASEIASLNKQINVIELTGVTANELRDQRDLIIDGLSKIVDVKVSETPIYDTTNLSRDTGANRYQVEIAGGQMLVDTNDYNQLVCNARASYETVNQSDATGLFDISWTDGREFNVYSDQIGGELRGLIEMRDGNNGENFQGTVNSVGQNAGGNTTVNISFTASYMKELETCTLSDDGGVIRLGNEEYVYDSFSVTYGADGKIASYEFVISNDTNKNEKQPDTGRIGKEAEVGNSIDYQGIPYYQQQMNEWVRKFSGAFNSILTGTGSVDGYGKSADVLFTAEDALSGDDLKFLDSRSGATVITSTDDSYYRLTAKNMSISADIRKDAELLATHTEAAAGQDKSDITDALIKMRTDKSTMSFRGSNAGEFLQCILSDISLNASSANTLTDNSKNLALAIENQRQGVSGVDGDEEALNLVKYQHAYNLASQMIQVLSEVYDRLILQTGV